MASSVLAVIACLVIPMAFAYRPSFFAAARGKDKGTRVRAGTTNVVKLLPQVQEQRANNVHWRRRLQHAASGLAIASSYKWVITDAYTVVGLLCLFCACFLALHAVRRRHKKVNDIYLRVLGPLLRPHEVRGLPGAFWFMLGAAAAVALFPRAIALQSLLHLSVGDPVASIAGIRMGARNRLLPSGKSLAGTLAAFVACGTSTLLLFGWSREESMEHTVEHDFSGTKGFGSSRSDTSSVFGVFSIMDSLGENGHGMCSLALASVLGGVSGAFAEVLPLRVDDNLTLPVMSGIVFLALHRWQAGLCGETGDGTVLGQGSLL